jgi:fructoselysine 6-kinase
MEPSETSVLCGGVVVNPGDLVFGDENGAVVEGWRVTRGTGECCFARDVVIYLRRSKVFKKNSLSETIQFCEARALFKIIGIGDNVVDRYLHLNMMFPGGNSVNVPVLARRLGAEAAYIGVLGSDEAGGLVKSSLAIEGVDISRVKVIDGPNGAADVNLVEGERVFVGGEGGVSKNIFLTDDDLAFASGFDLIHSSVYSYLEHLLPAMRGVGVPISYDFSEKCGDDYIDETMKYVDYAFFSGGECSLGDARLMLERAVAKGATVALVTLGARGAVAYDGKSFFEQGVVKADVIDTMGAGDAFIARFLFGVFTGEGVPDAMSAAAGYAAKNCAHMGTFGYGAPIR